MYNKIYKNKILIYNTLKNQQKNVFASKNYTDNSFVRFI